MSRIKKLQNDRATALNAMTALRDLAETEDRDLTAEEMEEFGGHKASIARVDAQLEVEEELQAAERNAPQVAVRGIKPRAEDDPQRGFADHKEFFVSVIANAGLRSRENVSDERLRPLAVSDKDDKQAAGELAYLLPRGFSPAATAGSDEQGGYADRYGGFAIPSSRAPGLLQVGFEGDPTAGMTQNIPMATPSVEIMARTDKDHTTSVSGGFTVTRRPETVAASSSRMDLEMVTLKASSLFGLAYATEELLQDSAISFAALIDAGFRTQFGAHLLNEKIRGGGGNEYLGVLSSPAKVEVSKESGQAADTIVADNVIKMAARCWGLGSAAWFANHDTRPQLYKLNIPIGTGGVPIYQPSREVGFPDMLLGRPVYYTEYAAKVGDAGDIMLVNWSQFLEGTYQPLQSAESVHVRFVNHERTFKLWTRNAGAPWWRSALTPNKSSDTLSPIVTLAARA